MPENETLVYDARFASRWQPIKQRIDAGHALTDVFQDIQDQFYRSLQKVWRQWKACNVDPTSLFDAALNDSGRFDQLVRKTGSGWYARFLGDVAAGLEQRDMEGLVGEFVDAVWQSVQSQLQLDRHDDAISPKFASQVHEMLGRISRSLARNVARFPSRVQTQPPADISAQLAVSLT